MSVPEGMRIDIVPGGPYLVHGNVPLVRVKITVSDGESVGFEEVYHYPQQETYALCRCGSSKNKPFCDGSHVAASFEGRCVAPKETFDEQAATFEGDGITLKDAKRFCIGARFCDRAGGAWSLTNRSDDPQCRADAIIESELCPSGRLQIVEDATQEAYEIEYEPSIALIEDPLARCSSALWVRGGIPIFDENGEQLEVRNRVTLCRCGKSRNIPYCDGTHYVVRFNDGHIED